MNFSTVRHSVLPTTLANNAPTTKTTAKAIIKPAIDPIPCTQNLVKSSDDHKGSKNGTNFIIRTKPRFI
jgi:hypothetical protein